MIFPIGHSVYSWEGRTVDVDHSNSSYAFTPDSHTGFSWGNQTDAACVNKARAMNKLGALAKKKCNVANACQLFLAAIKLDATCVFAYLNIGNILADVNRIDLAVGYLHKATAISPYFEAGLNSLASLLLRTGRDLRYALALSHQARALEPQISIVTASNLNNALRRCGMTAEAIDMTWKICGTYDRIEMKPVNTVTNLKTRVLTVVCIKWGTKYGSDYVDKLFRGIKRNLNVHFAFLCFTDDPTGILEKEIEIHDIDEGGWLGWWTKSVVLFDGRLGTRELILYVDLDTIITGSLDDFIGYTGNFAILGKCLNRTNASYLCIIRHR